MLLAPLEYLVFSWFVQLFQDIQSVFEWIFMQQVLCELSVVTVLENDGLLLILIVMLNNLGNLFLLEQTELVRLDFLEFAIPHDFVQFILVNLFVQLIPDRFLYCILLVNLFQKLDWVLLFASEQGLQLLISLIPVQKVNLILILEILVRIELSDHPLDLRSVCACFLNIFLFEKGFVESIDLDAIILEAIFEQFQVVESLVHPRPLWYFLLVVPVELAENAVDL